MPIKGGMLYVASQGNLYVTAHNKSVDGAIKQGFSLMWLDGCRVTQKCF